MVVTSFPKSFRTLVQQYLSFTIRRHEICWKAEEEVVAFNCRRMVEAFELRRNWAALAFGEICIWADLRDTLRQIWTMHLADFGRCIAFGWEEAFVKPKSSHHNRFAIYSPNYSQLAYQTSIIQILRGTYLPASVSWVINSVFRIHIHWCLLETRECSVFCKSSFDGEVIIIYF